MLLSHHVGTCLTRFPYQRQKGARIVTGGLAGPQPWGKTDFESRTNRARTKTCSMGGGTKEEISQAKAPALGPSPGVRCSVTIARDVNQCSLAKHISVLQHEGKAQYPHLVPAPTMSRQQCQEQSHDSGIPLCHSLPRLLLYCLWESTNRQATNYADREAFKNMLPTIFVSGQKLHTFTCGKNGSSFSWGPLPSSFLCFDFLVFLSLLKKRTGHLSIIKANYFSQNTFAGITPLHWGQIHPGPRAVIATICFVLCL